MSTLDSVDNDLMALVRVRALCRNGRARALRQEHRLALGEVAAAVGATACTVSRWELGRTRPYSTPALLAYGELLRELEALNDEGPAGETEPSSKSAGTGRNAIPV